MRKGMLVLLLLVVSLSAGLLVVHGQEEVLDDACPYTDGAYFQAGVFPRYEFRNQRLILVSWNTGKLVSTVETSLQTPRFNVMNWSPDCRYLTAALGEFGATETVVWDVINGQRMAGFEGAGLRWSPDSQQAVVSQIDGLHLWTVGAESPVQLTSVRGDDAIIRWDDAQVWVLPYSLYYSAAGVTAFSRADGQQVGYYDNPAGQSNQIGFTFAADKVIVYTVRAQQSSSAGVTIWNRDGQSSIQVDAGSEATGWEDRIALSPDAHYLAIGGRMLRVWDLQNLPAELNDRDPVSYSGPQATILRLRFIDDSTLETVTVSGSEQWNVLTGEPVATVVSR